jgi:cellulose synthase/poly-beta-1,6-N-acetylglucosamine synthase-like glycosyltransferase
MSGTPFEAAFWCGALGVGYTYLGYPALVWLLAVFRDPPHALPAARPSVSVVLAVYNEAAVIARKLENLLAQLGRDDELIVVSDGSTDGSDTLVAACADSRIRLLRQEPRRGKNGALNLGVRHARGAVVVFTDANAMLCPGALHRLLLPFADARVGLVSGQGMYGEGADTDVRLVSSTYARCELLIRKAEASLGFLAGVDGALYAMRRELCRELPFDEIHDLLHPIQVASTGACVRFAPDAFTVEPASADSADEFRRQVRIIAQGFRVLARELPVLLLHGRVLEVWMLASHRLLRWLSGALLAQAFVANLFLLDGHALYRIFLVAQLLFVFLAGVGVFAARSGARLRALSLPYYFGLVSFAGLVGLMEYTRGRTHSTWSKELKVP